MEEVLQINSNGRWIVVMAIHVFLSTLLFKATKDVEYDDTFFKTNCTI